MERVIGERLDLGGAALAWSAAEDGDGPLVFDARTDGLEAAFTAYRELYAAGADVEVRGAGFFADVRGRGLAELAIFTRTLRGVTHARDAARVRRDGFDHVTLQCVRAGVMQLDCDGARAILHPGDCAVVDMTRPYRSQVDGRIVTASVSRRLLRDVGLGAQPLHGVTVAAKDAAPLGGLLDRLAAGEEDALDSSQRLAERLRLSLTLERVTARVARFEARRERALAVIRAELGDPELTPARVARETGMSRATLFRVFEPLGGVSNWLLSQRLRRARVLLATTDMSVAEVGCAAGLPNASHLAFAFQKRLGVTPSAYRRQRLGSAASPAAAILRDIDAALAPGAVSRP